MTLTSKAMNYSFRLKLNEITQCCSKFLVLLQLHITICSLVLPQSFFILNCIYYYLSHPQLRLSLAQLVFISFFYDDTAANTGPLVPVTALRAVPLSLRSALVSFTDLSSRPVVPKTSFLFLCCAHHLKLCM